MSATVRRKTALRALLTTLNGSRGPGAPGMGERFAAVPRMIGDGFAGRYPHLDRGRLMLAALALVYIVSPIDAMPEAVFSVFGLGDDALVAAWLAGAMISETDTFLAWERARGRGEDDIRVVPSEVINESSTRL